MKLLKQEYLYEYSFLTYPSFRHYMEHDDHEEEVMAIGVDYGKKPIGLALACGTKEENSATLLSLYIDREHRNEGHGSILLRYLEEEATSRGYLLSKVSYMDGQETFPYWEKVLKNNQWEIFGPTMLFLHFSVKGVKRSPLMETLKLPDDMEIFSLESLNQEDQQLMMEIIQVSGYPSGMNFAKKKFPIEPATSLCLKRGEKLLAWVASHQVSEETIWYTSLYSQHANSAKAYGLALIKEVVQRHCRELKDKPKAILGIPFAYDPMIRLAKRKLLPFTDKVEHSWTATKSLRELPMVENREILAQIG